MMNWEESRSEWSWPNLRYYPAIFLEELRKILKTCQDSQSLA
jgi:hypothetical protein